MKILIQGWALPSLFFLLSLVSGCNQMAHYDQHAMRTGDLMDTVSTQGLDSALGYETLERIQHRGSSEVVKDSIFYFALDDTKLAPEAIVCLKDQAKYLLQHPNAKLLLAGHTDERGSREYNIGLGERRAKRVAEVLEFSGVQPRQIRMLSYGREKPQALGHNESAWRKNRRVELVYE